jgi:hypothetical protein
MNEIFNFRLCMLQRYNTLCIWTLFCFLQVQGKERGEDVGAAAAHLPLQAAYPGHGEADRRHPPHGGDGGGQEHSGRPVLAPPSLPGTFTRIRIRVDVHCIFIMVAGSTLS